MGVKKDFIVRRSITMVEGKPHVETYSEQELVRCKDCISFYKNDNMFNTNAQKGMRCRASSIDPDWFCADGEKKSD